MLYIFISILLVIRKKHNRLTFPSGKIESRDAWTKEIRFVEFQLVHHRKMEKVQTR